MKTHYIALITGFFLLIHFDVEAQFLFCDCPQNTIFVNLDGQVLNPPLTITLTKVNEIGCNEGQVDLLSLTCLMTPSLPEENEDHKSMSSNCLTDGSIIFSGNGVNGYCFDPVVAGLGVHDICICDISISDPCLVNKRTMGIRNFEECGEGDCCQFQIEVVDFEFNITDPCSCDDPLNIQMQGNLISLFHDVLRFETGGMGPDILSVSTSGPHMNFLDMDGMQIPGGTNLIYNGMDAWELDFWRPPGSSFGMGLVIELDMDDGMDGNQILLAHFISDECVAAEDCPAAPVPTLGFWTLIILGILMTIFSIAYIRKLRALEV